MAYNLYYFPVNNDGEYINPSQINTVKVYKAGSTLADDLLFDDRLLSGANILIQLPDSFTGYIDIYINGTLRRSNKFVMSPTATLDKMDMIANPVADKLLSMDAEGNAKNSGIAANDVAIASQVSKNIGNRSEITSISDSDMFLINTDKWMTAANLLGNYYTTSELDSGQLDNRYYTEPEIDTQMSGKSDTGHSHTESDITDLHSRYTEEEVQDVVNTLLVGTGNITLTYDDNGNTLTIDDSHTHDTRYYTEAELDTKLGNKSDIIAYRTQNSNPRSYNIYLSDDYYCTYSELSAAIQDDITDGGDATAGTVWLNANHVNDSDYSAQYLEALLDSDYFTVYEDATNNLYYMTILPTAIAAALNHNDLSNISASDHHSRYTDSEAITAINNDTDHGSMASHNYFSGSHTDLSNIGASDHHSRYSINEDSTSDVTFNSITISEDIDGKMKQTTSQLSSFQQGRFFFRTDMESMFFQTSNSNVEV